MENSDFYTKLGSRIETLRKKRGLSAEKLANRIGKTKKTIRRYELGEVKVSHDVVLDIANVLDKPASYFYQEILDEEDANNDKKSSNIETIAAHIDDDVTEEEMEDIVKYIEFIKSQNKK